MTTWQGYYLIACSVVIFTKYQNLLVFYKKICLMEVQVEVIFFKQNYWHACHTQPEKTDNISWCHHWFPHEMTSEKWVQKFHADGMTNQKHCPDVGSDTSSVWNFCDRFSDPISWGNRWWHRKNVVCFLRLVTQFAVFFPLLSCCVSSL